MELAISINPTYKCNLDCEFCYLKGLHNSALMDLNKLDSQLFLLSTKYSIKYIDLYGGEITLLNDDYLNHLLSIVKKYTSDISIVSNFVKLTPWLLQCNYEIGTSWDYKFRKNSEIILQNIDKYYEINGKQVSVLLCSPKLYDCPDEVLKELDRPSIGSYSLIPCMKSLNTNVEYDFQKYQETIKYFIEHPIRPHFVIEDKIRFGREFYKHIFINPLNEFVDVDYDENGVETFKKVDVNNLKQELPVKCLMCKHNDKCLNEHLDKYIEDKYDCIGCYKLLEWYNETRIKK